MTASSPHLHPISIPTSDSAHPCSTIALGLPRSFVSRVGTRCQAIRRRALRIPAFRSFAVHGLCASVFEDHSNTGAFPGVGKPFSELGTSAHERRR